MWSGEDGNGLAMQDENEVHCKMDEINSRNSFSLL